MSTLSIKSRILFFGMFILLGISILSSVFLYKLNVIHELFDNQYEQLDIKVEKMRIIMDSMNNNRAQLLLALQHNPKSDLSILHDHSIDSHLKRIAEGREIINKEISSLESLLNDTEKKDLAKWREARERFVSRGIIPVLEAIQKDDFDEAARVFLMSAFPAYRDARLTSDEIFTKFKGEKNKVSQNLEDVISEAFTFSIIFIGVSLTLILSGAFYLTHQISSHLQKMKNTISIIAQTNDLTKDLDHKGPLELSLMCKDLNSLFLHNFDHGLECQNK